MDASLFHTPGAAFTTSTGMAEVSLPPEVLSVLPSDPYSQLELAHKISCWTYQRQIALAEAGSHQMREALSQKQQSMKALERKLSSTELELQDLQAKYRQSTEDQHKLAAEKNALMETVKRLNREVSRLEHFKRNLLQSLQDEEEGPSSTTGKDGGMAAVDMTTERMVADVLHNARGAMSIGTHMHQHQQPQQQMYGAPQHGMSGAGPGPYSNGPSSTHQTPARSPPQPGRLTSVGRAPAASPRIDGKEFFKQARGRLSYEQFSKFLQSIKELNASRQTREETLRRAKDIFGIANSDLYGLFEGLLSRHITTI